MIPSHLQGSFMDPNEPMILLLRFTFFIFFKLILHTRYRVPPTFLALAHSPPLPNPGPHLVLRKVKASHGESIKPDGKATDSQSINQSQIPKKSYHPDNMSSNLRTSVLFLSPNLHWYDS